MNSPRYAPSGAAICVQRHRYGGKQESNVIPTTPSYTILRCPWPRRPRLSGGLCSISSDPTTRVLPATCIDKTAPPRPAMHDTKTEFLSFRNTRFGPHIQIRNDTNRWPTDRTNRHLKVAHRGREGRGTVITFCSVLETESSEKDGRRTKPATLTTVPRQPALNGYNRARAYGLSAFGSGTEAFGLAVPPRLGCRESHKPWSAPRISIRLRSPVTFTFYSRVTVYTALPPNHPFHHRT